MVEVSDQRTSTSPMRGIPRLPGLVVLGLLLKLSRFRFIQSKRLIISGILYAFQTPWSK